MTITSANSVVTLGIPAVFASGQQLQDYAADDMFDNEAISAAEIQMGVDGILTAGFVNVPVPLSFTLMADSPSMFIFDNWYLFEKQNQDKTQGSLTILLPSLKQRWTFPKCFLVNYKPMPDAKRVLQSRKFNLQCESFQLSTTP